ncbi:MAG: Flp pilus assembly protein, pilin Flp, partial [uncultured Sphingomonas sp.]
GEVSQDHQGQQRCNGHRVRPDCGSHLGRRDRRAGPDRRQSVGHVQQRRDQPRL